MANADLYARFPGAPATNVPPRTRPRQRPDPCADACTPVCPACNGLQCLCRPRFFAGQLLTDEDLNRLERYIIDKNRLHNRYLVGWGVACGLEVVCDACDGDHVIVRTGYALSPCGDDIIVCRDHSVNVCDLISQCRPQRDPICDPPQPQPPRDCRGGNESWVLAICYDERPSRGVTALLGSGDDACCSKCACGGSGSCGCKSGGECGCGCGAPGGGCGCNGSAQKAPVSTATRPRRTYAPQCEPTQICEGYRFVAYRAPKPQRGVFDDLSVDEIQRKYGQVVGNEMIFAWLYANRARLGPLLERLLCCLLRALELRSAIREGKAIDTVAGVAVYGEYAQALRDFAADFALHRCAFVSRVGRQYQDAQKWIAGVANLRQLDAAQTAQLGANIDQLDTVWLDVITECICSALLPACPGDEPSNCVPLAVITVGGNPCRVIEICNWEARKLLITWRTILYWTSWLPWYRLRQWLAALCCGDLRDRRVYDWLVTIVGVAMAGITKSSQTAAAAAAMTAQPAAAAAAAGAGDRVGAALHAPSLLPHLLADFEKLREGTDPQAPQWAELVAHLTDATVPGTPGGAVDSTGALGELQARVDALTREVGAQRSLIESLRSGRRRTHG